MNTVNTIPKFIVVGIINTSIDFAVLNIEILITGITAGVGLFLLNMGAFGIAIMNSYLMNKNWVFKDSCSKTSMGKNFSQFLGVSIIGAGINSMAVIAITAIAILPPQMSINVAKLFATGVSLVWNFIGYKFLVFR